MSDHQQQDRTASITTPAEREIHIERVFDAPRDRVFSVYTDPELIPEWWGPRGTTTVWWTRWTWRPVAAGAS